jgi:aspartyl/asparaginyl beta-hydroxylase (cupin superfamily)
LEDVGDVAKYYGVIRLEEYRNGGLFQIKMLSSILTNVTTGNILIPLTGETGTKITKVSTTKIRLECLIDFNDLNFNQSQYKISARLGCHELNLGKYNVQYSLKYN